MEFFQNALSSLLYQKAAMWKSLVQYDPFWKQRHKLIDYCDINMCIPFIQFATKFVLIWYLHEILKDY